MLNDTKYYINHNVDSSNIKLSLDSFIPEEVE
jgi:hypothetical protein